MKILLVSDKVAPQLYEHIQVEQFHDIDLILSAGDLPPNFLNFLTTILKKPLLYVHGNHDYKYETNPPEGCIDIDGMIYEFNGIRILGIGGCMEYTGGLHQYTEKAMAKRVRKMKRTLKKGFDILLTHSPAYELGDGEDQAHIGFKVFVDLIETYQPEYMIHGHQHMNYGQQDRFHYHKKTKIINAFGYYILDLE
ncbi:MAG: metallophosphoesterase family protein [Clostridia bacterium]|nr:metallophosphoesterase family protein [Clostridia bacterium]